MDDSITEAGLRLEITSATELLETTVEETVESLGIVIEVSNIELEI